MTLEVKFEVPKIRTASKLTLGDSTCYLFEMDHPCHTETTLMDIFDWTLNKCQWDRYIKPGSTAIDIGTHIGDTTIAMQLIGRGTVLGIEPNPIIKSYLDLNCHVNSHLGKFVTVGAAVTTQNIDWVEIMDHNNQLCNGGLIDPLWTPSLQARMRSMAGRTIMAPGLTLETICQQNLSADEINNISFIKTDTEGHDVSILDSSRSFLDRIKPVIFMEWFGMYTDVETAHMFDVIESIDYIAYDPVTLTPAAISNKIPDLLLIHKSKVKEYL